MKKIYENQKYLQQLCNNLEKNILKVDTQFKKLIDSVTKFDTACLSISNFESWSIDLNNSLYKLNNSIEFVSEGTILII